MPYTVAVSFDRFIENISLTGDHRETANARKVRIVSLLGNTFTILDSFPSGSVPRRTAVKGHADLDVIVVLHWAKHIKGKMPQEVLQEVRDALGEYRTNVRKNGQAVTLHYDSWPNVDIVPVSVTYNNNKSVNHYNVPDMNQGSWLVSRPRRHSKAIDDKALRCGPAFLNIVRMIKEWNKEHSDLLTSFHIEHRLQRFFIQTQIRHQLPQLRVLVTQLLRFLCLAHVHATVPRSSAPLCACSSTYPLPLSFAQIILSFVRKSGSIYGPIRFARALMVACGKETRAYIRPHTWKMCHLPGPDGICASSPNQVNGLERPRSPQVLKKLVSPLSPSCLAQASRLDTSTPAQKIYTAGRYACCFAIRDQRMRAFLLASATQALAVPSLCCLSLIHRLRQSVLALAR